MYNFNYFIMITFEKIEINQDKHLLFTINNSKPDVIIDHIEITTQDYYNKESDFKTIIQVSEESYDIDLKEIVMSKVIPDPDHEGSYITENKNYDLTKDLIIVTTVLANEEDNIQMSLVDCCDKKPAIGIAYYKYCLYKKSFNLLKSCGDDCDLPKDLINFILQYRALDLAIAVGDVNMAIKYWNKFFNKESKITHVKSCGCHG